MMASLCGKNKCVVFIALLLDLCASSQYIEDTITNVEGVVATSPLWADSYQGVDGRCYCSISGFNDNLGNTIVEIQAFNGEWWSVQDICASLGNGPGVIEGESPLYNTVQCGHLPVSSASNEMPCPGRVDDGPEKCGHLGPTWDFSVVARCPSNDKRLPIPNDAHTDIRVVVDVVGDNPAPGWRDSYSVGDECFCDSSFDHGVGIYMVETPLGWKSVVEVCDLLGPGPGIIPGETPVYNDVQCGNGPLNNAGDEHRCPGRTDIGPSGCGHIGPKWNFSKLIPTASPSSSSFPTDEADDNASSTPDSSVEPSSLPSSLPSHIPSCSPSSRPLPSSQTTSASMIPGFRWFGIGGFLTLSLCL